MQKTNQLNTNGFPTGYWDGMWSNYYLKGLVRSEGNFVFMIDGWYKPIDDYDPDYIVFYMRKGLNWGHHETLSLSGKIIDLIFH